MMTLETTQTVPLTLTDDGTIRMTGSRVSLDSIIHHYHLGATAEQIACKFQGLRVADIYAAIAYYLSHSEAIEEYLKEQEAKGDEIKRQLESAPNYQSTMTDLRVRMLTRRAEREEATIPSATD